MYNFESPQVCFTKHSPSSIFDDLTTTPSIKLGSIQTYCVRAANSVGYKFGYRSDPGCKDVTIAWESMVIYNTFMHDLFGVLEFLLAQVTGYVRSADTAGKLPTKEAIVEYSLVYGGRSYRGSTLTDADGYYELGILVRGFFCLIVKPSFDSDYVCFLTPLGTRADGDDLGDSQRAQDDSIGIE